MFTPFQQGSVVFDEEGFVCLGPLWSEEARRTRQQAGERPSQQAGLPAEPAVLEELPSVSELTSGAFESSQGLYGPVTVVGLCTEVCFLSRTTSSV